MTEPVKPFPPSSLMPFPEADLYSVIVPVSGAKLFAGSSVVTLHCMA